MLGGMTQARLRVWGGGLCLLVDGVSKSCGLVPVFVVVGEVAAVTAAGFEWVAVVVGVEIVVGQVAGFFVPFCIPVAKTLG